MTKSLGKPRQDAYTEILIEYSNEASMVYVNGLDTDGFWEEFMCIEAEDVEAEVDLLAKAYESIGLVVTFEDLDVIEDDDIETD